MRVSPQLVASKLSESDLDSMARMNFNIEKKAQATAEPVLLEILSYFKCSRCGECCRTAPAVISDDELIGIARIAGHEAFDALDSNMLMNAFQAPCLFHSGECRIYRIRPNVCKIFPFSFKNIGFVTLILCPLGKDIQAEIENFIKSKGKAVRYEHDKSMQAVEDTLNGMRELAGLNPAGELRIQMGLRYWYIPLFLKYLSRTKPKRIS